MSQSDSRGRVNARGTIVMDMNRRNRISQWAYDTRAVLGRFHLWLEDVDVRLTGEGGTESCSFVGGSLERAFVAAAGGSQPSAPASSDDGAKA